MLPSVSSDPGADGAGADTLADGAVATGAVAGTVGWSDEPSIGGAVAAEPTALGTDCDVTWTQPNATNATATASAAETRLSVMFSPLRRSLSVMPSSDQAALACTVPG